LIMLVAESRMVMGKAHVFHVGSLSTIILQTQIKDSVGRQLYDGISAVCTYRHTEAQEEYLCN
ncbi:hypothetical protein, partial [Selenomonas bovis]|uniref:hypothetical protein n=1 Tax=Selenomonas bovis TaxID=416586 RepID=UPI001E446C08